MSGNEGFSGIKECLKLRFGVDCVAIKWWRISSFSRWCHDTYGNVVEWNVLKFLIVHTFSPVLGPMRFWMKSAQGFEVTVDLSSPTRVVVCN